MKCEAYFDLVLVFLNKLMSYHLRSYWCGGGVVIIKRCREYIYVSQHVETLSEHIESASQPGDRYAGTYETWVHLSENLRPGTSLQKEEGCFVWCG